MGIEHEANMETWILIVAVLFQSSLRAGGAMGVTSIEFGTQPACEAAAVKLKGGLVEVGMGSTGAMCVPSGKARLTP